MGGYIIRRVVALLAMLLALTIIVFLLFSAVPTDPAALTCSKSCTPQIIAANRVRLGLNLPLYQQYWEFFKGIFVGRTYGSGTAAFDCSAPCLGYSFVQGDTVTHLITSRLPVTIYLAVGAFILWIIAGISSGIVAALNRGRALDRGLLGFALIGYSFPSFFIGLVLLYLIRFKLHLVTISAYVGPSVNFSQFFQYMILPWVTAALLFAAFYTRLTRTQMLETMGEDYIRTARAKGVSERVVVGKHALRAGLTPLVTAAGLDFANLLGGAVITESIFSLPGVGRLAIQSVTSLDLPVITGTVLLAGTFVLLANLIVDLLYAVIDPRVRLV